MYSSLIRYLALAVLLGGMTGGGMAQSAQEIIRSGDWKAQQVCDGVVWKHARFDNLFSSRQDIHVGEADLTRPKLRLSFPYVVNDRKTISRFAKETAGAQVVVNGNFLDPKTTTIVQLFRVDGTTISVTLPDISQEGAIFFDADGLNVRCAAREEFGTWEGLASPNLMVTNMPLITNGTSYTLPREKFYTRDRHPRTAVGVTTAGQVLLVAVDGRTTAARGMTFLELQELMLALGAWDAVNLDGGGSTALWVKGQPGNGIVNRPSDGHERPVPNGIAVVRDP